MSLLQILPINQTSTTLCSIAPQVCLGPPSAGKRVHMNFTQPFLNKGYSCILLLLMDASSGLNFRKCVKQPQLRLLQSLIICLLFTAYLHTSHREIGLNSSKGTCICSISIYPASTGQAEWLVGELPVHIHCMQQPGHSNVYCSHMYMVV